VRWTAGRHVQRMSTGSGEVTGSSDTPDADTGLWLQADELVVAQLAGLGASLFVTTHRLVIVRDGAGYRPRSGVRSWPHHSIHDVSLSPPKHGQGRIVVRAGPRSEDEISMFFAAQLWPDAARTIGQIRKRLELDGDEG
jgi:hypothetical protein